MDGMSRSQPIESRQYVWWHRVRRLGAWGFVGGLGGVVAPLITAGLQMIVIIAHHGPGSGFGPVAFRVALVLAPIYASLFAWTWWYMEHRYRRTLTRRCPACGYAVHASPAPRCPECGRERAGGEG